MRQRELDSIYGIDGEVIHIDVGKALGIGITIDKQCGRDQIKWQGNRRPGTGPGIGRNPLQLLQLTGRLDVSIDQPLGIGIGRMLVKRLVGSLELVIGIDELF